MNFHKCERVSSISAIDSTDFVKLTVNLKKVHSDLITLVNCKRKNFDEEKEL